MFDSNPVFYYTRTARERNSASDCGTLNSCTGEANAVTWPSVAVGEISPLWRRGQPCGWTVSPTLLRVLCLEGGSGPFFFFLKKDFFYIFQQHPGVLSKLHPCLSAEPWQTAAWICPPCQKRLETNWRSWIWSCLKVKEGRGRTGCWGGGWML